MHTNETACAQIIDPVGACIQPTDLSPFTAEDELAAEVPLSDVGVDVSESVPPAPVADTDTPAAPQAPVEPEA